MRIKTDTLAEVFRAASALDREATVICTSDGWNMTLVDSAHVAMVRVTVPASELPEVWETTFRVPCRDVLDAIKGADECEMTLDDGWLTITANGMRRRMRLLDPSVGTKVPDLEHDATCMVDSDAVRRIAEAFDTKRMQKITLDLSPEGLVMSVGDERDEAELTVPASEMAVPPEGEARVMLPLDYLCSVLKGIPRGRMLELRLTTDYPAVIDSSAEGIGTVWLLAPRIESE